MTNFSWKKIQILLLILTLIIISLSFSLEFFLNLAPCPLCIMQRISAILLAISFMVCLMYPKPKSILLLIQLLCASFGLYFAIRQLWIMSLPLDSAPICMPGLTVLIHYFPLKDILHALFWGSGECTENTWQFLGLSMPAWSTIYFSCVLVGIIYTGCCIKSKCKEITRSSCRS